MIRALALVLLTVLPARPAAATEEIVAGLSQSSVSITADFVGSEILIYGAVKRESAIVQDPPLQVIITVEGPSTEMTVRRKDRRYGIWLNNATVVIDRAPSYYAITTTAPLGSILSATEDLRHKISIPRAIRAVGISAEAEDSPQFLEALQRIRRESGSYVLTEGEVRLTEDTLFRADVALPANLTEGDYRVRIFLTRSGKVIDVLERGIVVHKEGLERFFFRLAHDQPLIYGLLSLVLAVGAGWGASAAFRLVRL
ncbi:MAG: TIGR02186 family protein [Paracoccaceae bacterium]|nr:TIGR02186 family protein [Paracoccaceae bacterium]